MAAMHIQTGEGNVVLNEDGFSDYYVVLYYTVTVNSDAQVVLGDDGNPNDVNLTWERTSEDTPTPWKTDVMYTLTA